MIFLSCLLVEHRLIIAHVRLLPLASEKERLLELRRFVADIEIGTTLLADTVFNVIPLVGRLPDDKSRLLAELDDAVARGDESSMSRYRRSIVSL